MTRAFIFDLDGVIADTTGAHRRSWARLADEEGIAFDDACARRLLGLTREDSLAVFAQGRALSAATRADWLARKQAYALGELERMGPADALPGVVALIDAARESGLRLGLASSSRNARLVIDRLAIASLFDAVADGASVARPKPAPDIFLDVAGRLGVPPSASVVFEDAEAGITAAVAGGFPVVALGLDDARATWRRASLAGSRPEDFAVPSPASGTPAAAAA